MNSSRSEEHTSELQSLRHLVCRLLLEKRSAECMQAHRLGACSMPPGYRSWGQRAGADPSRIVLTALKVAFRVRQRIVCIFFVGPGAPDAFPLSPTRPAPY